MLTSGNPLAVVNKRLWLALWVSMLLHVMLVAVGAGWLPDLMPDSQPLEVTLALAPPLAPKPIPKPVSAAKPAPKKASLVARAPKPVPPALLKTEPAAVPSVEHQAQAVPEPVPEPATAPALNPALAQAENPPPASLPSVIDEPTEPPRPTPPRQVEMEFSVDYDGLGIIERQRYQVSEDGRYIASSTAEAKGLLSLALSDLNQKSSGMVTTQGLRPETFTYQYGKKAQQKASFDWAAKTLTMEVGERKQSAALEEGTQDLLSFLYQFMFTPPLEQFQLAVTSGKQLKTYHYLFEGEEEIKTKLGTLRALHISKSSGKGEEKAEIWLAEDYHYLPVKIRKTNADGKVIQNTINTIKITP